jgi:hypothetical protein
MQPHQERVILEKRELDDKLNKLAAFLQGGIFAALAAEDRELLKQQAHHMKEYSVILAKRIANFKP